MAMDVDALDPPFWFPGGAGASEEQLREAEKRLGRKLPSAYRTLMGHQDGGTSQYSSFQRGELYVPLPSFFTLTQVVEAEERRESWGTPKGVIVIGSGAHEWLGLDYRDGAEPAVVYQEAEDSDIEDVALDFDALLSGLSED